MDGTILGQGTFTSSSTGLVNPHTGSASQGNAVSTVLQIPSGADWLKVSNYTQWGTVGTDGAYYNGNADAYIGFEFYWQLGMAPGTGIVTYYGDGGTGMLGDTLVSGGFTVYNPGGQSQSGQPFIGAPVAITAITNVVRPVVTCTSTAGLTVGSIVRFYSNSATPTVSSLYGIDLVIGTITNGTTFTLLNATNALATAPGNAPATGYFVPVYYPPLFYPRRLVITNITQTAPAVTATVATAIPHGLTAGQEIRFNIPRISGMTQLNGTAYNNFIGSIITSVVNDYAFTINVNVSSYTPFTFPTSAQLPCNYPTVTPIGEDTATALMSTQAQTPSIGGNQIYNTNTGILADSTVNTGYMGMIVGTGGNGLVLGTPIIGPAGSITWSAGNVPTSDTLYWVAGKSMYGGL